MQIQPPIINIFEKAVRKASKVLLRDFGEIENLQIESKNLGDFVTNADLKTEKILLETLKYYYPSATFITEESGTIVGDKELIVIDPIDGTTNFIHGIPMVGIVISKIFKNEITDGIIFNPILNEFYWSSKGKGSWCNNKRLRVSKRQNISDCVIGTGIPHANRVYQNYLNEIDNVSKNCSGLRRMGAASEKRARSNPAPATGVVSERAVELSTVTPFWTVTPEMQHDRSSRLQSGNQLAKNLTAVLF